MKVREDLSAQYLYDSTVRFLDLLRTLEPTSDIPRVARREALGSVHIFLTALCAVDEEDAA